MYYLADFTRHTTIAEYNLQLLENKYKLYLEQRVQLFRLKGLLDNIQLTRNRENTREKNGSSLGFNDHQNTVGGPGGQSGEGFVSQIILLKLNSLFNSLLEKASSQCVILWQTLSDESPKIQKIYKLLHNSWEAIENVEISWMKNKVFEDENMVAKRNYGLFLCRVLNQEQEGGRKDTEWFL